MYTYIKNFHCLGQTTLSALTPDPGFIGAHLSDFGPHPFNILNAGKPRNVISRGPARRDCVSMLAVQKEFRINHC